VSEAGTNFILVKAQALCYLIQFEQPMFGIMLKTPAENKGRINVLTTSI
jgi:hypothetical protein